MSFDTVPRGKCWEHFQIWERLQCVPLHLQQVVKAMYTTIYAKVQILWESHGGVMLDISVKQGCPLSTTLFGLYINELETYLVKFDWDSSSLFHVVDDILHVYFM